MSPFVSILATTPLMLCNFSSYIMLTLPPVLFLFLLLSYLILLLFLCLLPSASFGCMQVSPKLTFFFLHAERPCSRLATPPLLHQVLISHQTLQHQSTKGCLIRQPWAQLADPTRLLLHLLLWELLLAWGASNRPGGCAWGSRKQAEQMAP